MNDYDVYQTVKLIDKYCDTHGFTISRSELGGRTELCVIPVFDHYPNSRFYGSLYEVLAYLRGVDASVETDEKLGLR